MSNGKIFNTETLVSAIKEVAAVIAENGGADIKALVKEINEGEVVANIIIEPYCFTAEGPGLGIKKTGCATPEFRKKTPPPPPPPFKKEREASE